MGFSSPDQGGGNRTSIVCRGLDPQQMPTHGPGCFVGSMTQVDSGPSTQAGHGGQGSGPSPSDAHHEYHHMSPLLPTDTHTQLWGQFPWIR